MSVSVIKFYNISPGGVIVELYGVLEIHRCNMQITILANYINLADSRQSMMDDSTHSIHVTVLFFAKARELVGLKEIKITVPNQILAADLLELIVTTYGLESIKDTVILAVNEGYVASDVKLQLSENDVIAIIPPLSGVSPSCGAISTFIGTTRDNFDSKTVVKLEYEAYEPMASKVMNSICDEIRAKWNVKHVAIYHRLGEVPVCEASIAIAISSPHRHESLKAVEYAIDNLKSTVPIWKREFYDTTDSTWKENKECDIKVTPKLEVLDIVEESKPDVKQPTQENVDNIEINFDQVQVRADVEELNRRIKSLIDRKRMQVNTVNVQEFCNHRDANSESESSCARVNAILIHRNDSKSHVKVYRVFNPHGPQTMNFTSLVDNSQTQSNQNSVGSDHPILDERLSMSEKFLSINKPVPRDIYERIKNIEDRILYLEGISPEYRNIYMEEDSRKVTDPLKPIHKRLVCDMQIVAPIDVKSNATLL
ncbi:hypothetical protein PV325_011294 [Microctonus aethiopoides]|nr:hypothetical protein PV325_011294 [Microctonus aethiopoides]